VTVAGSLPARLRSPSTGSGVKRREVVIVGAGPYGLAAGAHLRARGVDVAVFGEPMSFWQERMPRGMLLRSPWVASHIASPEGSLTLDAFRDATGKGFGAPVPLEQFVEYGRWFERQAALDVDRRAVAQVERTPDRFVLTVADGEQVFADRVVIATGIAPYAHVPPLFAALPPQLASHSSKHRDLSQFEGRRLAVVGGGQSALESAALLHESGADVEVFVRAPIVHWLGRSARLHKLGWLSRLFYAPTDVGPVGVSQLVARPDWFRRLPRRMQDPLATRSIRPAGSGWLRPRLVDVPITVGRSITEAAPSNAHVDLRFDDGSRREFDHVLCATGFKIDMRTSELVAPETLRSVALVNGYPRLRRGFETTVPGLHVLGAPSAWSFGPLSRFVAGTDFAAKALTARVVE
jgi:cation diffusion facilitator CzcD-associated flavoprotein CzcO